MNETIHPTRRPLIGALLAVSALAVLALGMLAGSLFTSPARAAGPAPVVPGEAQTITVSGVGEVRLQPDMAHVELHIHLTAPTAGDALAAYDKAAAALTAALRARGLADGDIVSSPPSTWPIQPQGNGPGNLPIAPGGGYNSDGSVTVTVHDLATLHDLVMAGLKAAAGIGLGNVQYGLQNDAPAHSTALNSALDNARAQADAVAAKLGLKVVRVVSVTLQPGFNAPGPWMAGGKGGSAIAGSAMPAADGALAQLATRPDLVVNATVQVSYSFQ